MKFFILAAFLVAAVAAESLYTADEIETLKTHSKECVQSSHIEDDTLTKMRQKVLLDNPHLKDYLFCIFKKMHWMDNDGHMQKDAIEKVMAKSTVAKEAMDHCWGEHGATGPETAFVMMKCYMKHLPADFKITL